MGTPAGACMPQRRILPGVPGGSRSAAVHCSVRRCTHTTAAAAKSVEHVDRRRALAVALVAAVSTLPIPDAADALALAPLGGVEHVGGDKRTGLSADQVKDVLAEDLQTRQYFVTGRLTREVFADDARFADPTNDVTGLSKYVRALDLLFDPAASSVALDGIAVTSPRTVEADWQLEGFLRFPWHPYIRPLKGHTVYTLNEDGLIQSQVQTWSISPLEALTQSFTPTSGDAAAIRTPVR